MLDSANDVNLILTSLSESSLRIVGFQWRPAIRRALLEAHGQMMSQPTSWENKSQNFVSNNAPTVL